MTEQVLKAPPTPEQQATIRRIGLPIGIAGAICGVVSLAMLLVRYTSAYQPPALLAVNLSFCSMMMGIGILFYIRRTPGTRVALVASIIAIVTGIAGPAVFAKLSLDYRIAEQTQELKNVAAIADAARAYAILHNGNYAPDLATLLEQKLVTMETLHSPYERVSVDDSTYPPNLSHVELGKFLDDHTDYQYFGQGLRTPTTQPARPEEDLFAKIVVVGRHWAIERRDISIAYSDSRAELVSLEDIKLILDTSNAARKSLGFPEVHDPEVVERAATLEKTGKAEGN